MSDSQIAKQEEALSLERLKQQKDMEEMAERFVARAESLPISASAEEVAKTIHTLKRIENALNQDDVIAHQAVRILRDRIQRILGTLERRASRLGESDKRQESVHRWLIANREADMKESFEIAADLPTIPNRKQLEALRFLMGSEEVKVEPITKESTAIERVAYATKQGLYSISEEESMRLTDMFVDASKKKQAAEKASTEEDEMVKTLKERLRRFKT